MINDCCYCSFDHFATNTEINAVHLLMRTITTAANLLISNQFKRIIFIKESKIGNFFVIKFYKERGALIIIIIIKKGLFHIFIWNHHQCAK
jgi:hypothetical protein